MSSNDVGGGIKASAGAEANSIEVIRNQTQRRVETDPVKMAVETMQVSSTPRLLECTPSSRQVFFRFVDGSVGS